MTGWWRLLGIYTVAVTCELFAGWHVTCFGDVSGCETTCVSVSGVYRKDESFILAGFKCSAFLFPHLEMNNNG